MYGTRGILPSPGNETRKYGGNTTCIAIRAEEVNELIIVDAGSGIIKLGQDLTNQGSNYKIKILITHIHMDHLQGLPYFLPFYDPRNQIQIYYPHYPHVSLEKIIKILTNQHVNPVHMGNIKAKVTYNYIHEDPIYIKNLKITTCRMNHPIVTYGFKFQIRNKILTIATDHEQYENIQKMSDEAKPDYNLSDQDYCAFIENSDILIADAQYLPDEVKLYRGWGHSSVNYIVNQAISANVRKLVITHHDPNRSDLQIDTILEHYRNLLTKKGFIMELIAAKEVEEYNL